MAPNKVATAAPASQYGLWTPVTPGVPKRLTMLVYGSSGAGKTRFASTWPKPIFFDLENGLTSVQQPVGRLPRGGATTFDFLEVSDWIGELFTNPEGFQTLVVDSLNELQASAISRVTDVFQVKRPYDDQPTQADYGKAFRDFENIVRDILRVPMHIVLICQANDRLSPASPVSPLLVGRNSGPFVKRMVDIVGYAERQRDAEGSWHTITFDGQQIDSKDRTGMLPAVLEDPSWATMCEYWTESKG